MQCKMELYDLGSAEAVTPSGHTVGAYSAERTLCDILKSRSRVDIQVMKNIAKEKHECAGGSGISGGEEEGDEGL